ncbi:MAG: hypothetical protein LIR50_11975 [Bacillota bacterium]|nr:hypothetical protein [Bacillota bacterium]
MGKQNYITKDGRTLSEKQIFVLTINGVVNVSNLTYDECSKKIAQGIIDYRNRDKECCSIDEHEMWDAPIDPWGN